MSDKDTVAFNLLLNAMIEEHNKNKKIYEDGNTDKDFIDFTEDELKQIALTLWSERYAQDLSQFKNEVATMIIERSNKI